MKWHSVKDHQPVLSACCVLLAVQYYQSQRIYLQLGEWDDGWKDWDTQLDVEDVCCEVIYFCYPDPIPKVHHNILREKKNRWLLNFPAPHKHTCTWCNTVIDHDTIFEHLDRCK